MSPHEIRDRSLDSLLFTDDVKEQVSSITVIDPNSRESWKILVIDDDRMIHQLTDAVLEEFTFRNKGLTIIHGYSGKEACELMAAHPDTAVVLLDVVMETDNAGFEVVKYIREVLHNHQVRIILRTGQPGTSSEREIVSEYEINDYRDKSDLTSAKLHSSLIISLRAFQEMKAIQTVAQSGNTIENILHERSTQMEHDKENIKSDFNRLTVNGNLEDDARTELLGLINKSSSIIYIKDLYANYILVNNTFEEFFHVESKDVIGQRDDDFLPKPLAEQIMKSDMRVLRQSAPEQNEETIQYNDVCHVFYSLKFPLYDLMGHFCAICGVITEMTDDPEGGV